VGEREALRSQATDLIQRLRAYGDDQVPHVLWELLNNFARRLDRIEVGTFESQDDVPTAPRGISSANLPAVNPEKPLDVKVAEIFDQAKKPPSKKDGE
jgi:hypothetical protein